MIKIIVNTNFKPLISTQVDEQDLLLMLSFNLLSIRLELLKKINNIISFYWISQFKVK